MSDATDSQVVRYELAQLADGDPEMRVHERGPFMLHSDHAIITDQLRQDLARAKAAWDSAFDQAMVNGARISQPQPTESRLRLAVKSFINAFDIDIIEEHGYQPEWTEMSVALSDAERGAEPQPATSLCSRTALDAFLAQYWPQLELRERAVGEPTRPCIYRAGCQHASVCEGSGVCVPGGEIPECICNLANEPGAKRHASYCAAGKTDENATSQHDVQRADDKQERCPCGTALPPLSQWSMPNCPKCVEAAEANVVPGYVCGCGEYPDCMCGLARKNKGEAK
jgi:hypothetical protein